MATPQPLVSTEDIRSVSSRLVWVLNRDTNPYKATFRDVEITVPPNMEKIPKHVRDGGNLMEYLEACKFVRDLKQPQKWVPDRGGKFEPIFGIKALCEVELTPDEFKKIVGKTKDDLTKESLTEERKAKRVLKKELDKIPNKTLATDEEEA